MSKQQAIDAVADAYQGMSDAASVAADKLDDAPAPTFSGGAKMDSGVHDWFKTISKVYGNGSDTIANGSYSQPSDLKTAIDSIEAKATPANDKLQATIGSVDPAVSQAIVAQPECSALVKGRG